MTKSLKIIFAGTPEFTLPSLDALATSRHELIAVYTQPDRAAGRGQKLQLSAVKTWALGHNLPVYQPINFKSEDAIAELAALEADLMVVIAYGLILPKRVLAIPRLGCINVHASILPRWRGASPIQQAILHGDGETGVTIMQMDAGMDTGDRLSESRCPVLPTDTASTLHDRLAELATAPLLQTLDLLAEGLAKPEPQDSHSVTYAAKIQKEDAFIDWTRPAQHIDQQIRAFNPWPVAWTHANDETLKIHRASIVKMTHSAPPGTILSLDKQGMLVATGEQALLVEQIQFPGGKAMSISAWLNAPRSQLAVNQVLK